MVFPPKGTDRVVVGVGVGAKIADRDMEKREGFDLPTGEGAGRVAVDEQGQQHSGRILLGAGPAMIDAELGQRQRLDGVEDEVNPVVRADPIAPVRWEEHRGRTVDVHPAGGPEGRIGGAIINARNLFYKLLN